MATIAPCPHCGQSITLPDDVPPDQRFLCPLCDRAFDIADAVPQQSPATAAVVAAEPKPPTPEKRLQVEFVKDIDTQRQAPSMATLQRRIRKSNWFGHLLGIIGGGLIGLTAGYLILLKLRGPEADFLHVADRLPPWASELLSLPPPQPDDAVAPSPNTNPTRQQGGVDLE